MLAAAPSNMTTDIPMLMVVKGDQLSLKDSSVRPFAPIDQMAYNS